jgi:carboxypeptidase PM20D1
LDQLSKVATTNALIRTTMAPTMLQAGIKSNVLPTQAKVVINFRIHPMDSIDTVVKHIKSVIDDENIKIQRVSGAAWEPSKLSPIDETFTQLQKVIQQMFPDVIVVPSLVLGATDSRYFNDLTEHIYRFTPWTAKPGDINRVHGNNERLSINDYMDVINFYYQLIYQQ